VLFASIPFAVSSKGAAGFFSVIVFLVSLASIVSGGVGSLFCCWAPKKSGTRPLIMTAASLEGLALFLIFVGMIVSLSGADGSVLERFAILFSFVGWILFMIFLSKLASFLRDAETAKEVLNLMFQQIALIVGMAFVMTVIMMMFKGSPKAGAFVIFGLLILTAAGNIKILFGLMNVLGSMRQLIYTRW
jgi:hypothetical protein